MVGECCPTHARSPNRSDAFHPTGPHHSPLVLALVCLVLTVFLIIIATVALAVSLPERHDRRAADTYVPWNNLPPSRPQPRTPPLHARARVVFARTENSGLVLDCVLTEGAGPYGNVDPGFPITLSLAGLETGWMAAHVEAMLERWASGERIVELDLRDSPAGPRATLVSASSRLVLPLTTVVGLN